MMKAGRFFTKRVAVNWNRITMIALVVSRKPYPCGSIPWLSRKYTLSVLYIYW